MMKRKGGVSSMHAPVWFKAHVASLHIASI